MSSLYSRSFSRSQQLKLLLVAAMATGILATMAGRGTLAYFSTQVTSTADTFTTGTLHFEIAEFGGSPPAGAQGSSGTVASSITLTNMKPGDVVYAPLTINNAGSLDARWGIKYTTSAGGSTDDLAKTLQIAIVGNGAGVATGSTTSTTDCTSTGMTATKFPEQILPLGNMAVTGPTVVVDNTNAAHTTDGTYAAADTATLSLPLLHAATDLLCVEVYYPSGAPGTADGSHAAAGGDNAWNGDASNTYSTTLVFTMDGRQLFASHEFDETTGAASGNH
jgi:camelysin-like metallo-endopeptidase